MHRTMIAQMAIDRALLGFNDLERSMTLFFSETFHLQSSLNCPKNKQKMEGKKIHDLSARHQILPSCGCKVRELVVTKCKLGC